MISRGSCAWFVGILLSLSTLFPAIVQAKSLLRADLKWGDIRKTNTNIESQPDLTSLLALRDVHQDPVLQQAMRVVDTLATQSTCHQAAAAQLLITCKATGRNHDSNSKQENDELLERAKSVYAVRVAVCETKQGRAIVPSACTPVLRIPQRLDSEIDVVNSKSLSSCLEALMVEHYYWTSYSNNRQDANTLCQASTLEATRLEALHSYQKLAELLPTFRDVLGSARTQWQGFLKQQRDEADGISKIQEMNKHAFQQQYAAGLEMVRQAANAAKTELGDVSNVLQRSVVQADVDINLTREKVAQVLADFQGFRDVLNHATRTASEHEAEIAAVHAKELHTVQDVAMRTTEALKGMNVDEVTKSVGDLFQRMHADLEHVLGAQKIQVDSVERQLHLSNELSEKQKAHLAMSEQLRESSSSVANGLDSVNVLAGRMSSKLDKVNHALLRVERASSVLSTLFALIAIPSQIADHLHLRLLGLFAMPATLLYYWMPHRYSYTLMAIYVSLESVLSIIAEYRQVLLILFEQVGQYCRAWLAKSSARLKGKDILPAAGIVVLLCLFLAFYDDKKPKAAAQAAKTADSIQKLLLADRQERILRSKRSLHEDDRFRRASTVG